jgi:hypothetical protein
MSQSNQRLLVRISLGRRHPHFYFPMRFLETPRGDPPPHVGDANNQNGSNMYTLIANTGEVRSSAHQFFLDGIMIGSKYIGTYSVLVSPHQDEIVSEKQYPLSDQIVASGSLC